MITLYDYLPSQNAYKARLLLSHLQQPYRTKFVSIFEGEGQRAEYLRINPTGAVPAIELEDGRVLAESNAILWFLAAVVIPASSVRKVPRSSGTLGTESFCSPSLAFLTFLAFLTPYASTTSAEYGKKPFRVFRSISGDTLRLPRRWRRVLVPLRLGV